MAKTKKKTIITRKDEVRIQTLDTMKMLNMYIAEKVVKTWKEDFIDQDNGEVVTVERSEPLYVKGTLINQDVLAKIKFDIASGDIKEPIWITNQNREGYEYKNTFMQPWLAKAEIGDKNVKFLLYAQGVDNAMTILRDYIELNYKGGFVITEVKEFDDCVILEDTLSDRMSEDDISIAYLRGEIDLDAYVTATRNATNENAAPSKDKKYYQLEFKIKSQDTDGEYESTGTFVVNTFDTERAMVVVKAYLKMQDEQRAETAKKEGREHKAKTFSLLIEKAAPIPVGCFIPLEFSQVYAEQ